MAVMLPLAIVADTTTPYTMPTGACSAAYFAFPVTFSRPSTRLMALPMPIRVVTFMMVPLCDAFVGLRLRRGVCRLAQRPHDRLPR